tara:strand:- start:320 stop:1156 length:837 start_codon:yes stop_codon:yes gene_type:complete
MADELLTKVEKQMEGTNLALAAVAEVLQKMDARFAYDEEAQIRKEENDVAMSERTMLVKEIASEVVGILKQGGMDVDGTKVRSAAKSGASYDDTEKPAKVSTKIEDQQATIQAMRKNEEEDEDEEETTKGGYMKTHDPEDDEEDKDGAEEWPATEKDATFGEEEEEEAEAEKSMQKQLITLRKQLKSFKTGMDTKIQSETENRLRKMGFREENGLQKPQKINRDSAIGTDGTNFISKSNQNPDDVVDQLASLSYKQLRDMQMAIRQGDTDGIPRELLA